MIAFALATSSAMAEDYKYLTFETKDGAKASVEIAALSITINSNTLTAMVQHWWLVTKLSYWKT